MSTGRVSALEATRALMSARLRQRGPLYLVHAVTARCNARCGFCAWNPDFYDPREQLPTETIERVYSDARAAGFLGVTLWGGEPLVHRDIARIVRHARDVGLLTNLITNGFLLERRMQDVVPCLDRVCISLDHPSPEHDRIRGIPGLFDRIVSATETIRREAPDKPVIFICTLQRGNVDPETIRRMCALMRELGVVGVFNGMRTEAASGETDEWLDGYVPSAAQQAEAFATLEELSGPGSPILNSRTHLRMMRDGPPVYRCHWPKLMLPIEANGDVVDCMHWGTRPIANLRDTSLRSVLEHPRLAELAGPAGEGCHRCVSIHRVEISEVWEGNLEPAWAWRRLRH